jgi:uncharacterized protein (TIGR02391 family)
MAKVTLEDFKKNWEEQIAKIEKQALDNENVSMINLHFSKDKLKFKSGLSRKEFTRDKMLELDMLESKLTVALETANSRFKLENKGKSHKGLQLRIPLLKKDTSSKIEKESILNEKNTAERMFDAIITHPLIKQASENHFKNEAYRPAVLDAMIRLEEMIKEKAKFPKDNRGKELSGVPLMHKVFDPDKPILNWCKAKRQIERDELEGYKHVFAGAMQGIRDPKAHAIFEISSMRAVKLLTLATLLAELVDASEYMKQD